MVDAEVMRKYKKVPQPFIIEPPSERKRLYVKNDDIRFSLVIIGKAIEYIPYFIYAIKEMGKTGIGRGRGNYILKSVMWEDGKRKLMEIYNDDGQTIKRDYYHLTLKAFDIKDKCPNGLSIDFETPTRIVYRENFCSDPEFHVIIRNLLRRIGNLYYFHCTNTRANIDYRGLIKKAKKVKLTSDNTRWYDWERYSNRQETMMRLGGFLGSATYEGEFSDFLPFLWLGQWVHVGKNTSFGLGKYNLEYL